MSVGAKDRRDGWRVHQSLTTGVGAEHAFGVRSR